MLRSFADKILSLIAPQVCEVCRGSVSSHADGVACGSCWCETKIFGLDDILCGKCGVPSGSYSEHTFHCHECDDMHFDKASAVGVYEKALAVTVLRLKSEPVIPARLSRILDAALTTDLCGEFDLIIPVPLSKTRLVERGYNQAEVIARLVSRSTKVELDSGSLVRLRHTRMHRAAMDKKARAASVKNAFDVVRPKLVRDRNILLIDDIHTSGATVSSCARVLKKNGARSVNVFTLARAVIRH